MKPDFSPAQDNLDKVQALVRQREDDSPRPICTGEVPMGLGGASRGRECGPIGKWPRSKFSLFVCTLWYLKTYRSLLLAVSRHYDQQTKIST